MVPSRCDFEQARLLEIYIFHEEEPLFYSATVGEYFVVFLALADELKLCKELTSVQTLIQFEQGLFDGRDLFLQKEGRLFLWRSDENIVVEIDSEEASENKWHMEAGSFFKIRK